MTKSKDIRGDCYAITTESGSKYYAKALDDRWFKVYRLGHDAFFGTAFAVEEGERMLVWHGMESGKYTRTSPIVAMLRIAQLPAEVQCLRQKA